MGVDGHIPLQTDIGAFETELALDLPDHLFQENDGQVVLEAEQFTWQRGRGQQAWLTQSTLTGYMDTGYVTALPDVGLRVDDLQSSDVPELEYTIYFTTTGVYTTWLRGYALDGAGDSVYVSLAGATVLTPTTYSLTGFMPRTWAWTNQTSDGTPLRLTIAEPGLYTLRLGIREDGLRLDRLLLTTDSGYTPTGNGPAESE